MAKNGNIHPTRIFKTPEDLYKVFEEYKDDLKTQAREWFKVNYTVRGDRMEDNYKLPYTIEGFETFCFKNYGCVNQYLDNKDGYYDDFVIISRAIKKEIRNNQILGGMLGVYNANITARLNNLVEKTEDMTPQQPKNIIVKIKRNEDI